MKIEISSFQLTKSYIFEIYNHENENVASKNSSAKTTDQEKELMSLLF